MLGAVLPSLLNAIAFGMFKGLKVRVVIFP